MIETLKMKQEFEAILEKARGLNPLRQARERLALELQNLPYNAIRLQMVGRPLIDEKKRIEREMATVHEKEQDILEEVRELFAALVKDATQPVQEKMPALLSKRLRLRDLLAEAGTLVSEIDRVQKDWTNELNGLRKVAAALRAETNDSYPLPEMPLPTPLVPSPSAQQTIRLRERGDGMGEIFSGMAKQIA